MEDQRRMWALEQEHYDRAHDDDEFNAENLLLAASFAYRASQQEVKEEGEERECAQVATQETATTKGREMVLDFRHRQEKKRRRKRRSYGSAASGASESSSTIGSSSSSQTASSTSQERDETYGADGEPDVVLHVGACSFALHLRAVKRQSQVFYRKLVALRGQSVAHDHDNENTYFSLSRDNADGEGDTFVATPPFALRVVNGSSYNNHGTNGSELALSSSPSPRCPLQMPQSFALGILHSEKRRKPEANVFSFARCIAHTTSRSSVSSISSISNSSSSSSSGSGSMRRTSKTSRTAAKLAGSPSVLRERTKQKRGRGAFTTSMISSTSNYTSTENSSDRAIDRLGKENWDLNQSPDAEVHSRRHEQESLLREHHQEEEEEEEQERQQHQEHQHQRSRSQEDAIPSAHRRELHVEVCHADPGAVASLIEYMHTQKIQLVRESNAEQVIQLCRWLSFESDLMYTCLSVTIERASARNWMDLLLCCAKLHNYQKKELLIEQLLDFIRRLTPDDYAEVLEQIQMPCLGAIQDEGLLGRVIMCFTNHVRHVGVWRNILYSLEMWMHWTFKRRFVGQPPPSLLEFHQQYAPWDPFVKLPSVEVAGEEYYVHPKTLFRFGNFSFQVIFELDSLVLMQWRIIKESSSENLVGAEDGLHRTDPSFSLRGQLVVRFKCSSNSRIHEQEISLRYTHSLHEYGVWKPLVMSSSDSARLMSAREVKDAEGGGRSESETASSATPEGGEDEDFITARFTGRFFIWGHRLCNLYHYLSVCTLFYSSPTGSIGDLHNMDVIEKMRRLPVDTLVMILQSDRLRIPGGETTLVQILTYLCFHIDYSNQVEKVDSAANLSAVNHVRALFGCVRWCFADLTQIMKTLERSAREYRLYELIENGLKDPHLRFPRRLPWGKRSNPYQVVTPLVEFQIEAGDRSLSPGCFPPDLSELVPRSSKV